MILRFSKKMMLFIAIATAGLSVVETKADVTGHWIARAAMLAGSIVVPYATYMTSGEQIHPLWCVGAFAVYGVTDYCVKQYMNSSRRSVSEGRAAIENARSPKVWQYLDLTSDQEGSLCVYAQETNRIKTTEVFASRLGYVMTVVTLMSYMQYIPLKS